MDKKSGFRFAIKGSVLISQQTLIEIFSRTALKHICDILLPDIQDVPEANFLSKSGVSLSLHFKLYRSLLVLKSLLIIFGVLLKYIFYFPNDILLQTENFDSSQLEVFSFISEGNN